MPTKYPKGEVDPLQEAAEALAKATPDYAGKSAYPPLIWWAEGNELVVLCADNRKVRGPLPAKSPQGEKPAVTLKIAMHPQAKADQPSVSPKAAILPAKAEIQDPGQSIPGKPPAKPKAGK